MSLWQYQILSDFLQNPPLIYSKVIVHLRYNIEIIVIQELRSIILSISATESIGRYLRALAFTETNSFLSTLRGAVSRNRHLPAFRIGWLMQICTVVRFSRFTDTVRNLIAPPPRSEHKFASPCAVGFMKLSWPNATFVHAISEITTEGRIAILIN